MVAQFGLCQKKAVRSSVRLPLYNGLMFEDKASVTLRLNWRQRQDCRHFLRVCPLYSLSCHSRTEDVVAPLEPKITTATAVMTATKLVSMHARLPG